MLNHCCDQNPWNAPSRACSLEWAAIGAGFAIAIILAIALTGA